MESGSDPLAALLGPPPDLLMDDSLVRSTDHDSSSEIGAATRRAFAEPSQSFCRAFAEHPQSSRKNCAELPQNFRE
eukprot:10208853-Alexandrium_andersonii.AAC.1